MDNKEYKENGRAQQKFIETDYALKFYESLKEAEKTLEYTLLFPKILPIEDSNDEHWIEKALLNTYRNCQPYIFHRLEYNFFGPRTHLTENPFYSQMNNFHTDNVPSIQTLYQNDFFASSILNQCLMSAYDSVIRLIHPYYISPSALFQVAELGFSELAARNLIDYSDMRLRKNWSELPFPNPRSPKDDTDNRYSGLYKKLDHYHAIFQAGCPLLSDTINESKETLLYNSDIIYSIVTETNARAFRNFLSIYNNNFRPKYTQAKKLDEIHKELYYAVVNAITTPLCNDEQEINLIDKLYYYYRIERIFSLDLLNCIFQNINALKDSQSVYPDGINELNDIAFIGKLPNVFSRNAYLQYAFEAIKSYSSISKSPFLQKGQPPIQNAFSRIPDVYPLSLWRDVFLRYSRFLGDYAIPIQEWYFIITLFKTVSFHRTNQNKSTTLGLEELQILQKLLSSFIERNAKNICRQLDNYIHIPKNETSSFIIIHPLTESEIPSSESETTSGVFSFLNYSPRNHYCSTLQAINKHSAPKYSMPIQELSQNVLLRKRQKGTDTATIQQSYMDMIIEG